MANEASVIMGKLKEAFDKLNQDNSQETKKGDKSSTDPLPEISEEGGNRMKMLLETGTELAHGFFERADLSGESMRNHQVDIDKYAKNEEELRALFVNMLKEQKFDDKLLKLSEEQKDLRCRIIGRKQQVAKQEISRLKYLIKTMKGVVLEDDIEGKKLIDEMKGYLKTAEAQLESCEI